MDVIIRTIADGGKQTNIARFSNYTAPLPDVDDIMVMDHNEYYPTDNNYVVKRRAWVPSANKVVLIVEEYFKSEDETKV